MILTSRGPSWQLGSDLEVVPGRCTFMTRHGFVVTAICFRAAGRVDGLRCMFSHTFIALKDVLHIPESIHIAALGRGGELLSTTESNLRNSWITVKKLVFAAMAYSGRYDPNIKGCLDIRLKNATDGYVP
ncbi:hypothetical protein Tco_1218695 [Tanacetum coccineum]